MTKRTLTESQKKIVAGKQKFKCANKPGSKVIKDYECPLWKHSDGSFEESLYEIDHIKEFSLTKNDSLKNLQALCLNCHRIKTSRFMAEKNRKRTKQNQKQIIKETEKEEDEKKKRVEKVINIIDNLEKGNFVEGLKTFFSD